MLAEIVVTKTETEYIFKDKPCKSLPGTEYTFVSESSSLYKSVESINHFICYPISGEYCSYEVRINSIDKVYKTLTRSFSSKDTVQIISEILKTE